MLFTITKFLKSIDQLLVQVKSFKMSFAYTTGRKTKNNSSPDQVPNEISLYMMIVPSHPYLLLRSRQKHRIIEEVGARKKERKNSKGEKKGDARNNSQMVGIVARGESLLPLAFLVPFTTMFTTGQSNTKQEVPTKITHQGG